MTTGASCKWGSYVSALCAYATAICVAYAQTDTGVPTSKKAEWNQKYNGKTSSEWKTYTNKKTGEEISINPKTSELWFNPVTKKLEPVLREENSPDPSENQVTTLGKASDYQKSEKWFNPVTKKFENVIVESRPEQKDVPAIQYPTSLDNGLPVSTAKNWQQLFDDTTSSEWRTYKNSKNGQTVSFNPKISELWFNPVKKIWEPVARESEQQRIYIKQVARQWAEANRPQNATGWKCNFTGTVHNSPSDCGDPDQGGHWVTH